MEQKKEGRILIKVAAVYLMIFAAIYLILGIFTMMADVEGLGAAYGNWSKLVTILAFGTAVISFIAAAVGMKAAKGTMNAGICKVLGIILLFFGAVSLLYIQITQNKFELFDMVVVVCGIFYMVGSKKIMRCKN